jgi:hypothetical protein
MQNVVSLQFTTLLLKIPTYSELPNSNNLILTAVSHGARKNTGYYEQNCNNTPLVKEIGVAPERDGKKCLMNVNGRGFMNMKMQRALEAL